MDYGKNIGRYEIRSKLGAGGMGEVYLAYDPQLDRKVALKVLSPEFSQDDERRKRFLQESRAVSALNHPSILTIYEIGEHEGNWFMATEFIEGKTLRAVLNDSPLTLQSVAGIAEQLAAALSRAHEAGIIHRDIKPENIMIRDDGIVKILDFGLAKLTESQSKNLDTEAETRVRLQTSAGLILGTLAYMSPEQARGQRIDARTDVWSLGVVLYEMLTGKSPFAGETTSDIIAAILRTETASLSDLTGQVPAELEQIIFKALSKDSAGRYQTMREFQAALKNFKKQVDAAEEIQITYSTDENLAVKTGDESPTKILSVQPTGKFKEPSAGLKRFKTIIFIGALALAAVVAGIGFRFYFSGGKSLVEAIAVIPFVNVGDNPEAEYLSDGITESLINSLSQLPNLTVKARSSVFRYKGKDIEPQKLGAELSVPTILTGRVTGRGDGITINLELIDTKTGNLVWGETYNRKASDLVGLQSDIVRDVSKKLRREMSSLEEQRAVKQYSKDSEAYRLYLKGRYYLNTRKSENFEKAIQNFQQAIEREPDYALAYAGLSDTYTEMSYWSFGLPKETLPKARSAAQKAIEFDETLSESHSSLGAVAEDYDWDFALAEKEYVRAVELNPNNAVAFDRYGGFLCEQKRFREGLAKLERAAELDPLSLGVEMSKGACLYQEHRYDEAIAQLQKIIKNDPNYPPAYSLLGAIYFRQGSYEKTRDAWLKNSPLENYTPEQIDDWKRSFETGGIKGFLQKDIEFRKEAARAGRNQTLFIAMQYANLDDKQQALDWLERAFEERHSWLGELLVEPTWDNLRNEPRFQNLMTRVGFKNK